MASRPERANVLIIGEKGSGKSTIGNRILKKTSFDVNTEPDAPAIGIFRTEPLVGPVGGASAIAGISSASIKPTSRDISAIPGIRFTSIMPTSISSIPAIAGGIPVIAGALLLNYFRGQPANPAPTNSDTTTSQESIRASVIDTFGLEFDNFLSETKDKVLGHYKCLNLIVFVLKYYEEENEEAIQYLFDRFDKYFTREAHAITILVITHCERMKNEEVIEKYTRLCPTDKAKLGIIPVGFIENPSGPWKGRIIKKMKDDEEILQNLVAQCQNPVPADKIFH